MKRALLLVIGCLIVMPVWAKAPIPVAEASVSVAFSPNQGATTAIATFIQQAKYSIRVAAYSFTSPQIAKALVAAKAKGVDVKIVLDKSNVTGRYSSATYLAHNAVPLRINRRYKIMHSKYIIVDGTSVETGSFNYTKAAEEGNAENVLILRDMPDIAKIYTNNWLQLWEEGEGYASSETH